jgi:hypothetical protein
MPAQEMIMTRFKMLLAAALAAGASTAALAQSDNAVDLYATIGDRPVVQSFEGRNVGLSSRTVVIEGRNAVEYAPVYEMAPVASDIVVDPARNPN